MQTIVDALGAQQAELSTLVDALPAADWLRPSRCEGWTVADVVLHLAQTNEMAIASARGALPAPATSTAREAGSRSTGSIDDGADAMVASERGMPIEDLLARWHASADGLRADLLAADPHARLTWVAGTLAARTLATTRLAETWIHTGDVFFAFGGGPPPTDRLWHVARLAWRTLPYAFSRDARQLAGSVRFDLRGPAGDRWDFRPDDEPRTTIRGDGVDLCMVASRRVDAADTTLVGEGPDAVAVLDLVRTWA